jgi:hypothetical protein
MKYLLRITLEMDDCTLRKGGLLFGKMEAMEVCCLLVFLQIP